VLPTSHAWALKVCARCTRWTECFDECSAHRAALNGSRRTIDSRSTLRCIFDGAHSAKHICRITNVVNGENMPRLVLIEDPKEIKLLKELINKYHAQGCPRGGSMSSRERFYVYEIDGYWCAGAWLHGSEPFRNVAIKYSIPIDRSWFIRRICRFCPIECLVEFLNEIAKQLRDEGWECLWSMGLVDHSNALYKQAGFEEVGRSPRTKHPIFVRWLR